MQVIDSDESEEPRKDGKPAYQGRHRGADRFRQLVGAGGVLAAVAALLAGGGTVLFWVSGFGETEPLIHADQVGDLCELVADPEVLSPWADSEQARDASEQTEEELRTFDCTYSAEHAGDDAYRLVTLFATAQVYTKSSDARAAHAGVLDFEAAEGDGVSPLGGVGDQASIAIVEGADEVELRLHTQDANTTVSLNLFLTGAPPEGGDPEQLATDLASGLLDALPRDDN